MNLVLCELFHPVVHGFDTNSDPSVLGHFLVQRIYDEEHVEDDDHDGGDSIIKTIDTVIDDCDYMNSLILRRRRVPDHPLVRCFNTRINPEIAACLYLSGGECVAILKTFWLRVVQRAWKRAFLERQRVLGLRKTMTHLRYREIHGKWSPSCANLPGILGLIYGH
jgi:hypothetical protein